jgi:hypothetical protein
MTERPILFSSAMIRAILSGAKSQTRRVVATRHPLQFIGGRGEGADPDKWGWFFDGPDHHGYMVLGRGHNERHDHGITSIPCPYGEPGDLLWCKETWGIGTRPCPQRGWRDGVEYRADCADDEPPLLHEFPEQDLESIRRGWRPSIFMPRWASRITLGITEVRVQRLQEISEDDARAEGMSPSLTHPGLWHNPLPEDERSEDYCAAARDAFGLLWQHINGQRAPWSSNPWVWALTFRRMP